MRKTKKKKGLHPAVAVVFLVLAGGYAGKSVFDQLGGPAPGPGAGAAAPAGTVDVAAASGPAPDAAVFCDLLAVHGSYDRKIPVRLAFSTAADAGQPAPSPLGETAPVAAPGRWVGADPPAVQLGVVMISDGSRRAVIDGRVVGVGDPVQNASVVAIEQKVVTLKMGERLLTYDFDDRYPREFRGEQALREQERARQAAEAASAAAPEAAPKAGDGKDGKDGKTAGDAAQQNVAKKTVEEGK